MGERRGQGEGGQGERGAVQFGGLAARRHIRQLPSSPGNGPRAIGICRTPLVYHSVVEWHDHGKVGPRRKREWGVCWVGGFEAP